MKKIGNFLLVEQAFGDHNPTKAMINLAHIAIISEHQLNGEPHTCIETINDTRIAITGDPEENMAKLTSILSYEWEDYDSENV